MIPDLKAYGLCAGTIVYLKSAEACAAVAIKKWATNLTGPYREKRMRDLGVGHPVVIIAWKIDENGRVIAKICKYK
jgi:hypothetical protein